MDIGFHASHEQFAPRRLLELARLAEAAGFDAIHSSDHFHSWSSRQGHSGHAWCWLGAALVATRLRAGVVTAPGQRYHPAETAQAAATLAGMFEGRFWMAVGSGQLLNEGITGDHWPPKAVRQERLGECVEVMRALWSGQTVSHYGLVQVEEARLEECPEHPPLLLGAAVSAETAEWVGSWADGLITDRKSVV